MGQSRVMQFLDMLDRQSRPLLLAAGFVVIGGIGYVDYLVPPEIPLSLFYLLPISLIAWYGGKWSGITASLTAASVWYLSDISSKHVSPTTFTAIWAAGSALGFYLVVVRLLNSLQRTLVHERELARTDPMTGVCNSRHIGEQAQLEILRARRTGAPLTVVFIDLDNFKAVNDRFGHSTGDTLLRAVAGLLQAHLRATDVVGRIGGDEFALLLPDTDQTKARAVLSRLLEHLGEDMRSREWPVTFSVGALTCCEPPPSFEAALNLADELMYAVKTETKNGVAYGAYPGK